VKNPTPITVTTLRWRVCAIIRQVRRGRRYILIQDGRPVATIEPVEGCNSRVAIRARAKLLHRLAKQPTVDIGRWTREELYGR
jgi:antitoxin (DNA-binding transcriptional repressor) of toxin-antitoxin stability system